MQKPLFRKKGPHPLSPPWSNHLHFPPHHSLINRSRYETRIPSLLIRKKKKKTSHHDVPFAQCDKYSTAPPTDQLTSRLPNPHRARPVRLGVYFRFVRHPHTIPKYRTRSPLSKQPTRARIQDCLITHYLSQDPFPGTP